MLELSELDRLWLKDPDADSEVLELVELDRLALSDPERDSDRLGLMLSDGDSEGNETHIAAASRYKTVPSEKVTGIIRISPDGTENPVVTPAAAPANRLRSASEAFRDGPPTDVGLQAMRDLLS